MQPLFPLDPDTTEEERLEQHARLVREYQVEVFLQLDRNRARRPPVSREHAMKGTAFKAIYYLVAVLLFILYGALI